MQTLKFIKRISNPREDLKFYFRFKQKTTYIFGFWQKTAIKKHVLWNLQNMEKRVPKRTNNHFYKTCLNLLYSTIYTALNALDNHSLSLCWILKNSFMFWACPFDFLGVEFWITWSLNIYVWPIYKVSERTSQNKQNFAWSLFYSNFCFGGPRDFLSIFVTVFGQPLIRWLKWLAVEEKF